MESIVVINPGLEVIWYLRLANSAIDFVIILMLVFFTAIIAALLTHIGIYAPNEWFATMNSGGERLLGAGSIFLYYAVMEATTQRTIGKYITGTMVIDESGYKPSIKSILGRSLCRIFTIEVLSFFKMFPRGWHDSASGTYVVNAKKYRDALRVKEAFNEIGMQEA